MAAGSKKRTLDAFLAPVSKKRSPSQPTHDGKDAVPAPQDEEPATFSTHFTYPFPIQNLPKSLHDAIMQLQDFNHKDGKIINNQPHLDLLYYDPFIPRSLSRDLFHFLRSSLPFYRVSYTINRGPVATNIVTPRFTTVFGLDATSRFDEDGRPVDAATRTQLRREPEYTIIPPRPLPQCLEVLRKVTEKATGCTYNFCLVNYYSSGSDSVAYHSDDEKFLGANPAIASLSLGAKRDFLLKHKPVNGKQPLGTEVLKMPLGSGDMVLMRGKTQANWLHSVPKRSSSLAGGRINITFRKALVKGGTANYGQYGIGTGSVYRWDEKKREMRVWEEREEVKIHRGPVVKAEEQDGATSNCPLVKEEVKVSTTPVLKAEDGSKGVSSTSSVAKEEEEWKTGVQTETDRDMRGALKPEELAPADDVYAGSHPPIVSSVEAFLQDDDDEWEEKVRRDIEGEAN